MKKTARRRFSFFGTVQGVGFRPTVYRVAMSLRLGGFVQNKRSEVVVEVMGDEEAVSRFPGLLAESLPSAARIESIHSEELETDGYDADGRFRIEESAASDYRFPPIPPDLAVCADCARELFQPNDRRYLYPFITCTQCGPRYSIVERTPFDRETTSMRDFIQCPDCLKEYRDPEDRRFHSQTNSCPRCGPHLRALDAKGNPVDGDALILAIQTLNKGGIVALQGIGGFHLAVDPSHHRSMERIRAAKERERKPFALMVRDLDEARRLCVLAGEEEETLASPESPILIAPRAADSPDYLKAVSDTETLGIMLPYSPLHLLLFRHPDAPLAVGHLVMTSGNRAGEPIATTPSQAISELSDTADLFLVHDRRIVFRADDSIMRMGVSSPPFLMRRSRGFVPRLVTLSVPVKGTVLALGGDLKSAPALARGNDVHLCPYLGDLDDPETFMQFDAQIHVLMGLYGANADIAVHDLHPLYRSTQWAERAGFPRRTAIQHHFAHVLSVMAEHGLEEALGLSFDGTGYGTDGTIWGGEFLHVTRRGFRRLGSFRPFPLPGGEAAVNHPPRIAFAMAADPSPDRSQGNAHPTVPGLGGGEGAILLAMIEKGVNTPFTSSLGRIFDAAAAALGLVQTLGYEGEGPIRLEGLARRGKSSEAEEWSGELLPFLQADDGERLFMINAVPLIRFLLSERGRKPAEDLALLFHELIARAALEGARRMRRSTSINAVALSGGVFQNLLLREALLPLLRQDGFQVFLNEKVPPGDGGLSLGQVYYVPE